VPMPVEGAAWPPPDYAPILDQLALWRAWYVGETTGLTTAYARPLKNHPSQFRGGVVGNLARMFWGQPVPDGQNQRAKSHVPVAADLASLSADLLFSDPPAFEVEDDAVRDRLDEVIDDGGLWSSMREGAEIAAAMGGVYLRVVWDKELRDFPWLAPVDPDYAIPEWSWDRLKAVTFWHVVQRVGQDVTRLFERHEVTNGRGMIRYAAYVGTPENVGQRVPLTEIPGGDAIAATLSADGDGDGLVTGHDKLTAVYVPNMRPNRLWRSPEGRSDFAGIEGPMDELDEIMTSWLRDIRLAKARLVVPEAMVTTLGRGQGATFDAERELLLGLVGPAEVLAPTLVQPEIRFEQHQVSAEAKLESVVRGAGYSMQTFSPQGAEGGAVTATEVAARERRSLTTRSRKIGYWQPALAEAIEALLAVDVEHFGAGYTPVRPSVEFPDAVTIDPKDQAETLRLLAEASAASADVKVRILHPDWDDEQVNEEVTRLTGTDLDRQAAALTTIAKLAAELGKAVGAGGIAESTAEAIMEAVLAGVVDEDGDPIDVGPADFARSAELADAEIGAASAKGAAALPGAQPARPAPGSGNGARPAGPARR
jgi:A118 family predicted phage portal protein